LEDSLDQAFTSRGARSGLFRTWGPLLNLGALESTARFQHALQCFDPLKRHRQLGGKRRDYAE